jgi:hypothetical protein
MVLRLRKQEERAQAQQLQRWVSDYLLFLIAMVQ